MTMRHFCRPWVFSCQIGDSTTAEQRESRMLEDLRPYEKRGRIPSPHRQSPMQCHRLLHDRQRALPESQGQARTGEA